MTHALPWHLVGLGSNVLFPDAGIDGVVMRLAGELASWERLPQDRVFVGAGTPNAHVVRGMFEQGLVGRRIHDADSRHPSAAPVAMNAGTKDQELATILESVLLLVPTPQGTWVTQTRPAATLSLSYRHAHLPPGAVILGGTIALRPGDVQQAKARAQADKGPPKRHPALQACQRRLDLCQSPRGLGRAADRGCGAKGRCLWRRQRERTPRELPDQHPGTRHQRGFPAFDGL